MCSPPSLGLICIPRELTAPGCSRAPSMQPCAGASLTQGSIQAGISIIPGFKGMGYPCSHSEIPSEVAPHPEAGKFQALSGKGDSRGNDTAKQIPHGLIPQSEQIHPSIPAAQIPTRFQGCWIDQEGKMFSKPLLSSELSQSHPGSLLVFLSLLFSPWLDSGAGTWQGWAGGSREWR